MSHVTISASGFSSHSFFEQFDDGVAGGPIGVAGRERQCIVPECCGTSYTDLLPSMIHTSVSAGMS